MGRACRSRIAVGRELAAEASVAACTMDRAAPGHSRQRVSLHAKPLLHGSSPLSHIINEVRFGKLARFSEREIYSMFTVYESRATSFLLPSCWEWENSWGVQWLCLAWVRGG